MNPYRRCMEFSELTIAQRICEIDRALEVITRALEDYNHSRQRIHASLSAEFASRSAEWQDSAVGREWADVMELLALDIDLPDCSAIVNELTSYLNRCTAQLAAYQQLREVPDEVPADK